MVVPFCSLFSHGFQWIALANLSCLPLCSVSAIMLHSLTIWKIVSSALLHIVHIGETFAFSILAFITFVLRDRSCDIVIKPSVSINPTMRSTKVCYFVEMLKCAKPFWISLAGMVDTIFADVAQPDQARIVAINAHSFLKNEGHFVISIKVRHRPNFCKNKSLLSTDKSCF